MKHISHANRVVYWISLLVLTIATFFITLLIAPLAIFVNKLLAYFTTLFLGLLFGFIYAFIVIDLQHLDKKHHMFLSIYIPLVAVFAIYLIITIMKNISTLFYMPFKAHPVGVSFFFLFSFILPYLFFGVKYNVVK